MLLYIVPITVYVFVLETLEVKVYVSPKSDSFGILIAILGSICAWFEGEYGI